MNCLRGRTCGKSVNSCENCKAWGYGNIYVDIYSGALAWIDYKGKCHQSWHPRENEWTKPKEHKTIDGGHHCVCVILCNLLAHPHSSYQLNSLNWIYCVDFDTLLPQPFSIFQFGFSRFYVHFFVVTIFTICSIFCFSILFLQLRVVTRLDRAMQKLESSPHRFAVWNKVAFIRCTSQLASEVYVAGCRVGGLVALSCCDDRRSPAVRPMPTDNVASAAELLLWNEYKYLRISQYSFGGIILQSMVGRVSRGVFQSGGKTWLTK